MTLTIQCGQCGKQYSAPDTWAGRRAKCPKCGGPMEIPAPAANSEPDDFGLELLDEGPAPAPAAVPTVAGPPSNPFAAIPAPAAASPGLGPASLPRKPKRRKTSAGPSIGHTLATFVGSHKLLTAAAVVMGLVILSSLCLLVTFGIGRSGSRPEGTADTAADAAADAATDQPEAAGSPAGSPGPGFRGPTGPRFGPPGGSGLDSRLQQFIDRFGADKVVTIKVQNVSSEGFFQATQGVLTAAGVQTHSASHTGSQATIVVAPVDDVEALAAKLDIGKVTNVDAAKRTITVDAEADQ